MRVVRRTSRQTGHAATVVPRRRTDVMQEVLDHEAILIDPVNGHTHRLAKAALVVWHMCDGKTTMQHMAAYMTETWDIHLERALAYVTRLIALFAELNLLERSQGLPRST